MDEKYRLKRMADLIKPQKKILDLGCSAIPNPFLKNNMVYGVDLDKKQLPKNYTNFMQGDVMQLNKLFPNEKIDGIVAGELLEHLKDPISFLENCFSVLEKGGMIVLSTPNPNSLIERLLTLTLNRKYFYTKNHLMLYPQRWLIRIMELAGFQNIKLYSGGMIFPFLSLIPFPRPWCYQTIAVGYKS